jgi:hypothetical protein
MILILFKFHLDLFFVVQKSFSLRKILEFFLQLYESLELRFPFSFDLRKYNSILMCGLLNIMCRPICVSINQLFKD